MSTVQQSKEFDRNLQPRERHIGVPKFALRQRSSDHPMGMFFVIVVTAFAAMALIPPSGSAFASLGVTAIARAPLPEEGGTTAKTSRLPMSETDIACRGQAWGAESEGCLAVIAKESGKGDARKIRTIASAEP
jgi:hypothetical protein